jgi:hypothetical protein
MSIMGFTEGAWVAVNNRDKTFDGAQGTITEFDGIRAYVRFSAMFGAWVLVAHLRKLDAIELLGKIDT